MKPKRAGIVAFAFFTVLTLILPMRTAAQVGHSSLETLPAPGCNAQSQSAASRLTSAYNSESACGWNVVPSPNLSSFNSLYGVDAIAPDNVWAVGSYSNGQRTFILRWDGIRWSQVSSPNVGPGDNVLNEVLAISASDIWAVGHYHDGSLIHPLIMHWDGSAWSISPTPDVGSPTPGSLRGIAAVAPDDVWAVGSFNSRTLMLHWDGTQWSIVPTPTIGELDGMRAMTAIAADDVWAVGSYSNGCCSQTRTLTMHWDGSEWSIVPSPSPGINNHTLRAVAAFGPDDVWAVGEYSNYNRYSALAMHWDGTQWTTFPTPNPGELINSLEAMVVTPTGMWAVGNSHTLQSPVRTLVMRWNGIRWSLVPSQDPGSSTNYLFGIDVVATDDLWAVGGYASPGTTLRTLTERYSGPCPCSNQFTDVDFDHPFFAPIACLACHGVLSGYACGTPEEPCDLQRSPYYRPNNNVTRGQLAKIIANAARFNDPVPPGQQTFEDVPPTNPFWTWIERLSSRGAISGYQCGGAGEPCGPANRPYFRHGNNATRGQISKIVSSAANLQDPVPNTQQTFEDVPNTHPFWTWIERLSQRGIISGYQCGGAGEPCGAGNRPYFRPHNNTTRAQMAKIAANTFYPGCQTP